MNLHLCSQASGDVARQTAAEVPRPRGFPARPTHTKANAQGHQRLSADEREHAERTYEITSGPSQSWKASATADAETLTPSFRAPVYVASSD